MGSGGYPRWGPRALGVAVDPPAILPTHEPREGAHRPEVDRTPHPETTARHGAHNGSRRRAPGEPRMTHPRAPPAPGFPPVGIGEVDPPPVPPERSSPYVRAKASSSPVKAPTGADRGVAPSRNGNARKGPSRGSAGYRATTPLRARVWDKGVPRGWGSGPFAAR